MIRTLCTCLCLLVAATLAIPDHLFAAPAAGADKLRPHRAVYDLKLKTASDRSGILGLNGRIVYEMRGSHCEGYTTRFRFFTQVRTRSDSLTNDQQSSNFESADGSSFNFVTKSFLNGQLEQDLRGEAQRSDDGLVVDLSKPEERSLELDEALFMTQHIAAMIDAARREETFLTAKVFDGSEGGDQVIDTTAVIGKMRPDATAIKGEEEDVAESFDGQTAWPVTVSYFSTTDEAVQSERLPIYTVSFLMHETGVSRDLTMNYADYALKADLRQIDYFDEAQDCE
ncbi:MAG: cell envelope integrity EipB family protein [Ahrensia sp.]|nr:cell envelope integrity EipB family protein [Ahrensia sp.]